MGGRVGGHAGAGGCLGVGGWARGRAGASNMFLFRWACRGVGRLVPCDLCPPVHPIIRAGYWTLVYCHPHKVCVSVGGGPMNPSHRVGPPTMSRQTHAVSCLQQAKALSLTSPYAAPAAHWPASAHTRGGAHAPPLRWRPGTCARQSRPRGASLMPAHTCAPTHGGARAPVAGDHLCLYTPGGSSLPFEGALWGRGPPAVPPGPSVGACPLLLSGAALCLRTGLRKDPPTCLGGATAVVWWLGCLIDGI